MGSQGVCQIKGTGETKTQLPLWRSGKLEGLIWGYSCGKGGLGRGQTLASWQWETFLPTRVDRDSTVD